MHLADGIIDSGALLAGVSCLSAASLVAALARVRRCTRGAAWTGALSAFVLAAQAINVPVLPGASAHVVGAGLMAITVGPARAIVGMFAVLIVQALLFADGGLTVLFVNAFNLAVLPVTATHLLRCILARGLSAQAKHSTTRHAPMWAAGLGSLLGNLLGALSLAALLVLGAGAPARLTFGWLVGIQTIAGVFEGVLAAVSVRYLARRAPALMSFRETEGLRALDERVASPEKPAFGLSGVLLLIGLALLMIPFASEVPDALELVVDRWGAGGDH